ncbi:MAG: ADP-ribosylglycohydrolase family protein, partial [Verrucomicrobiota bacterium]
TTEREMISTKLEDRFRGLILGTAVGDALGLPAEGMSPDQIRRRWNGDWKMRFCFGRGMISDDTEHTIMVAQSLLACGNDAQKFQRMLAWKLRWWFLALPAGVGFATARACLKLWIGVPPSRSGVKSAGNGPAMRAAVIGAFFAHDLAKRREFIKISTRLTHTDARAEVAALTIAETAAWIIRGEKSVEEFLLELPALGQGEEWLSICRKLADAYKSKLSVHEFACALGLDRGVTGYAFHTVPVAVYVWIKHSEDFRTSLISALDCGGDTDTVGAIVGALAGASSGTAGIPAGWSGRIAEWPRSVRFMEALALQLALTQSTKICGKPLRYFWPVVIFRNVFFLLVVLAHGFRRLLSPY